MEKEFFDDIVVVKRSGQRVGFNEAKVALAVKKGFDSVYEDYDEKDVNKVKEKVKDRYKLKKDKIREYSKEYRETHKEEIKERKKLYYQMNKERLKTNQKKYYESLK